MTESTQQKQLQQEQQQEQVKKLAPQKHNFKTQEQEFISNKKIYIKCIIISMGSINLGYNLGVLNLAQPKLNIEYNIQENIALFEGIIGSCLLLGAAFGCLFVGYFMRKFGGRKTTILCDIAIIFLVIFYAIPEYYLAVFIRSLLGIVLGINVSSIPQFIKSVTPTSLVGKTGSFQAMFISSGVLLAVCIGQGFPIDEEDLEKQNGFFWRFVLLFPIIPSSIRLFSFIFFYKLSPPIYYTQQNNLDYAEKALQQIYKENYIQEQLTLLKQIVQKQQQLTEKVNNNSYFKIICRKQDRNRLYLGLFLQILVQFSGITAIILYSKQILEKAIGDKEMSQYMSIGTGFFQVVPAFISGEITKCFGRKQIILWGYIMISTILIALGIITLMNEDELENNEISLFQGILTISLVFIYCIVFRMTIGTVTWTYTAEILQPSANGLAVFMRWVVAFLIGILFPISVEQFGIHSLFLFFAVCLILGAIYLKPKLIETKGLNQQEIENLFLKKQKM